MDRPQKCQVKMRLQVGAGTPELQCEGDYGHKGHHHLQIMAYLHRPTEECKHCESVKPEKRIEQKVQVSFYIA